MSMSVEALNKPVIFMQYLYANDEVNGARRGNKNDRSICTYILYRLSVSITLIIIDDKLFFRAEFHIKKNDN